MAALGSYSAWGFMREGEEGHPQVGEKWPQAPCVCHGRTLVLALRVFSASSVPGREMPSRAGVHVFVQISNRGPKSVSRARRPSGNVSG